MGPEEKAPSAFSADTLSADIRLTLAPGFRLLALRYPVSRYYTAWKAGDEPEWPEAGDEFVALLRRDYIVRHYELSRPQHDLLQQLAAGQTLAEALQAIADWRQFDR